jgi:hypothetical protein
VKALNGRIALLRGQLPNARRLLDDALAANPPRGRANALAVMTRLYLADAALQSKQPEESIALAERAIEDAKALQGRFPIRAHRYGLPRFAERLRRATSVVRGRRCLSLDTSRQRSVPIIRRRARRRSNVMMSAGVSDGAR